MPADGAGRLGRKLQSDLVLRTARGFYLIAALACLAGIVVAVVVALLAQAATLQSASREPVPAVGNVAVEPISFNAIDSRLSPPSNIRFVQTPDQIDRNIAAGQPLGRFDATTPNGLSNAPEDFELIGGADAGLFDLAPAPGQRSRTGLRATPALADQINQKRAGLTASTRLTYQLRMLARDAFGNLSAPADVTVSISIGPAGAPPSDPPGVTASPLQVLAREVALATDPQRTDVYFEMQKRALQVPQLCRTGESPEFVTQYRRAFEHARERLTPTNVELFFGGVCEAWREAGAQAGTRLAEAEAAALAARERNAEAEFKVAAGKALATGVRNIAIGAAVAALGAFLTVALFLAFLALEGHSKALRVAVEALVADQTGKRRHD